MTTRYTTAKTTLALAMAFAVVFPPAAAAAGVGEPGVPAQLAQIQATLQQLVDLLKPPPPSSDNTTRLLFPFATNQAGLDTALVVSNTGLDSTGTVGIAGPCTFHFFGNNAPSPVTFSSVAPGAQVGMALSVFAPAFQGYVEAVCSFPFAHGFGVLTDMNFKNLAATIPALVILSHRTTSLPESAGQ